MTLDEKYLRRCFELASRGDGFVSPDPFVGCVIVKNGRIVGEGYHRRFGGSHAEVEALRMAGKKAIGATLYVNLEPCSHAGKRLPCTGAIVGAGIKRVIACSSDPNPNVAGSGFAKLKQAGIQVRRGVLKNEAEELNIRFFTFMNSRMPYVGLKLPLTLNESSVDLRFKSRLAPSQEARKEGHKLRSRYDAVLVGSTTVERDNPQLTVRFVRGRNPLRVILDPSLKSNPAATIFRTQQAGTLVFTSARAMSARKSVVERLRKQGVYMLGMDRSHPFDLRVVLRTLAALGVSSLLVEGGTHTSREFLNQRLVHKVYAFLDPRVNWGRPASRAILRNVTVRSLGTDGFIEGVM